MSNPEPALALATVAVASVAACFRFAWLGWWERPLNALARRKRLAIVAVALAPLLVRVALLPWRPAPQPRVHDEFTLLLGADTLAHLRLANPTPPAWPHFEAPHILVRPVYASAFPIGPSVPLAIGQALLGHAWIGVWLCVGLMCGTMLWMLQGWLPARWALVGALLLALRIGVSSYWMNSYWGGALAATGGALVLGALPRVIRVPRGSLSVVIGCGLAILAVTRPFEGAVYGAGALIWLVVELFGGKRPPAAIMLRRVVLPLGLVLAIAGVGLGWYNFRITGHAAMLPYVLYRNTMSVAPHFIWQSTRPTPLYNNAEMRGFYLGWELHNYHLARDEFFADLARKAGAYWRFYFGPLLSIPLLALPWLWRRNGPAESRLRAGLSAPQAMGQAAGGRVQGDPRRPGLLPHRIQAMGQPGGVGLRGAILLTSAFLPALACQVWHYAHYAAPATGLAVLLVTAGLRQMRAWQWRRLPIGVYLVRCLPAASAVLLAVQVFAGPPRDSGLVLEVPGWTWPPVSTARALVVRQFQNSGAQHLVFVRYSRTHDPGNEWVYNRADIDDSAVIWARELDRASNEALMRRYPARRIWLVEPDAPEPRPMPYSAAPPQPMPFVAVGAPGIRVLRSTSELRRILEPRTGAPWKSCDVWNYEFTEATGVEGPNVTDGCCPADDRGRLVSFNLWFNWLIRHR